ncbi:MAG TPA: carboxyl transferase domain-containing protein [Acidimicrobiales bacterium]|nr:carboxyl transferase domain-containing protein [Acidimicrobiales bacterium]
MGTELEGWTGLLVANRGEVAVRVIRAAADLGVRSVVVHSEDDSTSMPVRRADLAVQLRGRGPAAYLDAEQILDAAIATGCTAVHPGYGFLSEQAAFAAECTERGLLFVGPTATTLAALGDKADARMVAERCGVPVLRGTDGATSLEEAAAFFESLGGHAVMLKAIAGGGGRGMRVVRSIDDLASAFVRCESEARGAFGDGRLYVEQLLAEVRHIEVQLLGDRNGTVAHLGERDCTIQRRHQKLIEIAPAPHLDESVRERLLDDATRLGRQVHLENAATVEFLVHGDRHWFVEANARLQVEHTITEEVTGVDLVQAQLRLAAGESLADLGLDRPVEARGHAVQARVNLETIAADGTVRPTGGVLRVFEPATGPGVRTDTYATAAYQTNPAFDSLLAKVIAYAPSDDVRDAVDRASRALEELRVEGVETNIGFLRAILDDPDVRSGLVTTDFVDVHLADLVRAANEQVSISVGAPPRAGAVVDASDPLAVLAHGKSTSAREAPLDVVNAGSAVVAPIQGTVVSIGIAAGDEARVGQALLVMEAMKMEHVIESTMSGVVRAVTVSIGDTVFEGHPLVVVEADGVERAAMTADEAVDLSVTRADLAEVIGRQAMTRDPARPDAVARRVATHQRTARENVDDLCDPGSFQEYGSLVIAAQRRRRSMDDLIARTPADGLIAGIGRVNGDLFPDSEARCLVMSYDYTVLAGTQGLQNHRKKDRLFELAERMRLPVVVFTEGGGGRPGDTDGTGLAGLDCMAFNLFGHLSGLVPLVAINSGRCFAGNASLLGCSDVVIATADSSIGMGGPAMIEGGGLGVFHPDEVGPMSVQVPNGVVDVAVADEAEAVAVAKKYLSYFQGAVADWECADQRLLRFAIPENRLRVYDIRKVIETMADTGSVLELRRDFGLGMITALIRIEGRPLGLIANNPMHLAGAITSDGADKAARFMQLCDAFDLPILFLCDTPGMMVGPEVEKTALVRHCSRMFVVGASVTVPFFTIVLRKGYGLGAQAMAGASFHAPVFTVAWPTGEFGGMGLEGAVKLGYRKELAAITDPAERTALFDEMVARMYEHGKALNTATHFEIDDVIDPFDSRTRVVEALRASPPPPPRTGKKRPCVDTW